MIQIRSSIFETNSSSTHAIAVDKRPPVIPPKGTFLRFRIGDFGWEFKKVNHLDYLYSALVDLEWDNYIEQLKDLLDSHNIRYSFEDVNEEAYLFYGVDHIDQLEDFLHDLFANEDYLLRYLFSPDTTVFTGNDNQEAPVAFKNVVNRDKDKFDVIIKEN